MIVFITIELNLNQLITAMILFFTVVLFPSPSLESSEESPVKGIDLI